METWQNHLRDRLSHRYVLVKGGSLRRQDDPGKVTDLRKAFTATVVAIPNLKGAEVTPDLTVTLVIPGRCSGRALSRATVKLFAWNQAKLSFSERKSDVRVALFWCRAYA